MDTKEILQKGSAFLRDCFRDEMDLHYEEEIALAVARQKENDVCCAIAAFLEIKTPETEIMRLLSKFYGIDMHCRSNGSCNNSQGNKSGQCPERLPK